MPRCSLFAVALSLVTGVAVRPRAGARRPRGADLLPSLKEGSAPHDRRGRSIAASPRTARVRGRARARADDRLGPARAHVRASATRRRRLQCRARADVRADAAALVVLRDLDRIVRRVRRSAAPAAGAAGRPVRGYRRDRADGRRRREHRASRARSASSRRRASHRPLRTTRSCRRAICPAVGTPLLHGRDFLETDTADVAAGRDRERRDGQDSTGRARTSSASKSGSRSSRST